MTGIGYSKLIDHEGEVLHGYRDSEGYLTIGIGHCIDPRRGGAIPQRLSRELFDDDIALATARCRSIYSWFDALDAVRQDVMVMLMFNMGPVGVSTFVKMLAAMESGDYQAASRELADSKWFHQVKGIRGTDLCVALRTGEWL